jgi:hypothetical protein
LNGGAQHGAKSPRKTVAVWSRAFDEPIPLPGGRQLITLKDAGDFITKLPKAEHNAPEWQTAMETLLLVVERGGNPMLARIAIMRALHRHDRPEPPAPRRKRAQDVRCLRALHEQQPLP